MSEKMNATLRRLAEVYRIYIVTREVTAASLLPAHLVVREHDVRNEATGLLRAEVVLVASFATSAMPFMRRLASSAAAAGWPPPAEFDSILAGVVAETAAYHEECRRRHNPLAEDMSGAGNGEDDSPRPAVRRPRPESVA